MAGGQGGRRGDGHLRADMRMLASLARNKLWSESIDDATREKVVAKLREGLDTAETERDTAALAKALASLEKNDLDRTRLLMDAADRDTGNDDLAKRLYEDINEIERMEGMGGPH